MSTCAYANEHLPPLTMFQKQPRRYRYVNRQRLLLTTAYEGEPPVEQNLQLAERARQLVGTAEQADVVRLAGRAARVLAASR